MREIKIAVAGATGRMGKVLIRLIYETSGVCLAGALVHERNKDKGQDAGKIAGIDFLDVPLTDDFEEATRNADGLIDFSLPNASVSFCSRAAQKGIFHVIAVTGFRQEQEEVIKNCSSSIPIVKSSNMSLVMNFLSVLVKQAARILPASDFDIEILEMHHKHKKDAPSGSSLMLAQAAAKGRSIELSNNQVRTRDGNIGPRPDNSIGFAVLRGGSIVGEHGVIFAGENERLTLSHQSYNPAIFAKGAITAALWACSKKPGLYTMANVFGFTEE